MEWLSRCINPQKVDNASKHKMAVSLIMDMICVQDATTSYTAVTYPRQDQKRSHPFHVIYFPSTTLPLFSLLSEANNFASSPTLGVGEEPRQDDTSHKIVTAMVMQSKT